MAAAWVAEGPQELTKDMGGLYLYDEPPPANGSGTPNWQQQATSPATPPQTTPNYRLAQQASPNSPSIGWGGQTIPDSPGTDHTCTFISSISEKSPRSFQNRRLSRAVVWPRSRQGA